MAPSGPSPMCIAKGTYILTESGNVLIEDLRAGDRVATLTGGFKPVKWIGWRKIDFSALPEAELWISKPVLISKSSLADQVPFCDLLLSRWHGVFANRRLKSADTLVNNEAIFILHDINEITYYHVELDGFEFIVANGLAVESYTDVGNRRAFDNYPQWLGEIAVPDNQLEPAGREADIRSPAGSSRLKSR